MPCRPNRASRLSTHGLRVPFIDLFLSLVASDAVALLDLADELFAAALDQIDVVVGQLAPLFADQSLELRPLALKRVSIHEVLIPLGSSDSDLVWIFYVHQL